MGETKNAYHFVETKNIFTFSCFGYFNDNVHVVGIFVSHNERTFCHGASLMDQPFIKVCNEETHNFITPRCTYRKDREHNEADKIIREVSFAKAALVKFVYSNTLSKSSAVRK